MLRWSCAAGLAVLAGLVVSGTEATAKFGTNPLVKPSYFVSPTGSDGGPCSRARPCRTFGRVYHVARPGQVVEVAGGEYPSQRIAGPSKPMPASLPPGAPRHIVLRAAEGAVVKMAGRLTLDSTAHLTLLGFHFPRSDPEFELLIDSCNDDLTISGSTGRRFFILEGNSNVLFYGGSWGGYATPGDEDSGIGTSGAGGPDRQCGGAPARPTSHLTFDHVTFHDVFWNVPDSNWGGSHPDCLEINGYVDGLTIKNSRFLRCGNTFLSIFTDQGAVRNVLIEHNTFVDLGNDSWYGMQITNTGPFGISSVVLQHNTYRPDNAHAFAPYSPIRTEADPMGGTPVKVIANSFQRGPNRTDCARFRAAPFNTTWSANTFTLGSRCGS